MDVDAVMADLGERLGMPGLRLDSHGACQLLFDQRWLVTMLHVPAQAGIGLHCPVTAAGEAQRLAATTLRTMLKAGFQGMGAGGATLCIGPDERVYLQRIVPMASEGADTVQRALELILDQAETWAGRLASGDSGSREGSIPVQSGTEWAMQRV